MIYILCLPYTKNQSCVCVTIIYYCLGINIDLYYYDYLKLVKSILDVKARTPNRTNSRNNPRIKTAQPHPNPGLNPYFDPILKPNTNFTSEPNPNTDAKPNLDINHKP